MQGVMEPNGSKISSDGSYSLPKGTDRTWFEKENKKKQSTKEDHGSLDKDIFDGDFGLNVYVAKSNKRDKQNELQLQGLRLWLKLDVTTDKAEVKFNLEPFCLDFLSEGKL
ncbi:hypothetical protein NFW93_002044 [Enterococcus faecalis]|nr:hypothetical protein [Enterococcus faecalis]